MKATSVPSTTFLAVALPSADAAETALREVDDLDDEEAPFLRDAAVVLRTAHGRIELQQSRQSAPGEALVGGGTAGLVAGVLLGLPVSGALVGLAGGALLALRRGGLPDRRMRQLGHDLQPGEALLCVLVDAHATARARGGLSRYGTVFEVELASDSDP